MLGRVIIGVDESGTGAWAGSYTVCALAAYEHDADALRAAGGKDSKHVTDIRRRASIIPISDIALFAYTHHVSVAELNADMRGSWRSAICTSVSFIVERLKERGIEAASTQIIIDGSIDRPLLRALRPLGIQIDFLTKAEDKVPAVGAASIFAKTERNDELKLLHEQYPQYGWNQNYGYPSSDHVAAIQKYGRSPLHRDWKIPGTKV